MWRGLILATGLLLSPVAHATDAVTEWTVAADALGRGAANWRTLAIMHQAMHDAVNAAQPVYARWAPPGSAEPAGMHASTEAALAAAAARVLTDLHPGQAEATAALLQRAIGRMPPGPETDAGLLLGDAIGGEAVARRRDDGAERVHDFIGSDTPGSWRPTPPERLTSATSDIRPFLFADRTGGEPQPPPVPGGPIYLRDAAETRAVGGLSGAAGALDHSRAAVFWAYQSAQRGFMRLAVVLLDGHPRPGGLVEHARVMSILATALADGGLLAWAEKERFNYWRPVTAIQEGGFGVAADPRWVPLLDTPPFPEYPSGHAADCFTAAGVLEAVFGAEVGEIEYEAVSSVFRLGVVAGGMGQHDQGGASGVKVRRYPSLSAAARECSESRIWAGAHFRAAEDESERLAGVIVRTALAAVPKL